MSRQEILDQIKEAFGFVPEFHSTAPDAILEAWWNGLGWSQSDTALSARDKILISYGAAAALHCEYCVPFHAAQLALYGLDDEQIKEASWAAQFTAGSSTYLYGIAYDKEKFMKELDKIVKHIKASAQK